jgi:hypothetical protein
MCLYRSTRYVTTTPYYTQPSLAERSDRNLRAALTAYYHQNHLLWDKNVVRSQSALVLPAMILGSGSFQLILKYISNSPLSALWFIKDPLPDNPDP